MILMPASYHFALVDEVKNFKLYQVKKMILMEHHILL